jgi:glycosyltransferase involved in cell wall biosynthesis
MKIGFVGNTNNYPFMLARVLRSLGHEVVFYVDSQSSLCRPENRYKDIKVPYPEWIVDISGLRIRNYLVPTVAVRRLRDALGRFDLLVLNGLGPAIASSSRVPSFCMLTGSDLEYLAAWPSLVAVFRTSRQQHGFMKASLATVVHAVLVWKQRRGIRSAFGVNYFAPGLVPAGDRVLDSLGITAGCRTAFMLSGIDSIAYARPPVDEKGRKIRIFNVARLNWQFPVPAHMCDLDMKGTDILLKGVARFIGKNGPVVQLVLVRKGNDVTATEQLVRDLCLDKIVIWHNEMSQLDVVREYAAADIITDQLSIGMIGMGSFDAMAAGRPVIANGKPEIFDPIIGKPSPILQARTDEEVFQQLERLVFSPGLREEVGMQSRRYVEQFFSPENAANVILTLWERVATKQNTVDHSSPNSKNTS